MSVETSACTSPEPLDPVDPHVVETAAWAVVDLDRIEAIDSDLRELIPLEIAARHRLVPLWVVNNDTVVVAVDDPTHEMAFDDIHWLTGWRSQPVVAAGDTLRRSIPRLYGCS